MASEEAMGLEPRMASAMPPPSASVGLDSVSPDLRNNVGLRAASPDRVVASAAEPGPLQVPPQADVFEKVIRSAEGTSRGSGNVLYGGQPFDPGSQHPKDQGWAGGVGPDGRPTSAAGWPQWEQATWHGQAERIKALGVEPNFADPQQNKWAAWDLGSRAYKAKTGRDLAADITAGNADWQALGGVWQGLQKGVGPHLVNGPFSPTAQGIVDQMQAAIKAQQPVMDEAIREAKDLHGMARAMGERWMKESDQPPTNMRQAWSQWSGLAGALALFGGAMGGRSMAGAVSAAGEMLQSANSADQKSYDDAYRRWGDHLDRGMKAIELLNKEAQSIIGDAKLNYDQQLGQLKALSDAYGVAANYDHVAVQRQRDELTIAKERSDLVRAQNQDTAVRNSVKEKDEAYAQEHGGDVSASIHAKHIGEAEREIKGTANAEKNQIQQTVFANLKAKYLSENMDEATATARAARESGFVPQGKAPTQAAGREEAIEKAVSADVSKFRSANPEASKQQIDEETYKSRLRHEEEMGAASRQPRSAPAMALQQFIKEHIQQTGAPPTSAEMQQFAARGTEQTAEGRMLGTRSAALDLASNAAEALMPLVKQASDRIDRTEFPTVNSMIIAAKKGTGNTDVVRFMEMINSLKYLYARALSPTGQARVADLANFEKIIGENWTKGQVDAGLDQIKQSLGVEKAAVARTREEFRGGSPSTTSQTWPAVPSDLPDPAGHADGSIAKDDNGKPVAVIRGGKWERP